MNSDKLVTGYHDTFRDVDLEDNENYPKDEFLTFDDCLNTDITQACENFYYNNMEIIDSLVVTVDDFTYESIGGRLFLARNSFGSFSDGREKATELKATFDELDRDAAELGHMEHHLYKGLLCLGSVEDKEKYPFSALSQEVQDELIDDYAKTVEAGFIITDKNDPDYVEPRFAMGTMLEAQELDYLDDGTVVELVK